MTASVKFIDLLIQHKTRRDTELAPIGDDTIIRYIGVSCPTWYRMESAVISAFSFDGNMWCYHVRLPDGTLTVWMDIEVEIA